MHKKKSHFAIWLLSSLLCLSNSFSVVEAEEEKTTKEPETTETVEEVIQTEETTKTSEGTEDEEPLETQEEDIIDDTILPEETYVPTDEDEFHEELDLPEITPDPQDGVSDTDEPISEDDTQEESDEINDEEEPYFTINSTIVASGDCGNTVTWTLDNEGTLRIEGTGAMKNFSPVSYDENESQSPWYSYRETIKSVEIKSGVTSIGNWSFMECSNLVNVIIPDDVNNIGMGAFYKCISLPAITIPDSVVKIGIKLFEECNNLSDVKLSNQLTTIPMRMFYNCFSLSEIKLPESVTTIGESAFMYCTSLSKVDLPANVTSIGGSAFGFCDILTNITVPDTVTSIGAGAFQYCALLQSIEIPAGVTSIENHTYQHCDSVIDLTIPNNVTSIGSGAFSYCTSLDTVVIPSSVNTIKAGAFSGCSNLKTLGGIGSEANVQIEFSDHLDKFYNISYLNVTETGKTVQYTGLFANIEEIMLPSNVKTIGNYAFYGLEKLGTIELPEGLVSINDYAFSECDSLDYVEIPEGVISLGNSVFAFCDDLADLRLPKSLQNVGEWLVNEYSSLKKIYYNGSRAKWEMILFDESYESWSRDIKIICWEDIKIDVHGSSDEVQERVLTTYEDYRKDLNNIQYTPKSIKGPKIEIGSYKFDLFVLDDPSVNIPIKDKVSIQFKADTSEKKICILFGYKAFSSNVSVIGDKNSISGNVDDDDFWKAYTESKDLYKFINGGKKSTSKSYHNEFKKHYDKLQKYNVDMLVNASARICGYAEYSYETGELMLSDGGISVEIALGKTFNHRIPQAPYSYITVDLQTKTQALLQLMDIRNYTINSSINAGVGVGIGDNAGQAQAYVEGGFDGSLGMRLTNNKSKMVADNNGKKHPLYVDMTGDLYFEYRAKVSAYISFLGIQIIDVDVGKKHTYPLYKFELYPELKSLSTDSKAITMSDFFEESEPISRLYSYNPSLLTVNNNYIPEESVYPYPEQQLFLLKNGNMLMVWVGDTGEKPEIERTSIMYSVFSNGIWSNPQVIHENNAYNDHPKLCQYDDKVFLVWMRADSPIDGNWDEMEMLKHMELAYSEFNEDSGMWSEPFVVSDQNNQFVETDYDIASNGNHTAVAWVENTENDLMMNNGINRLFVRTTSGSQWSKIQDIFSTTSQISNVTVKETLDGYEVYYVLYDPGNQKSVSYVYKESLGNESVVESGDHFSIVDGHTYTLKDSVIYCDGEPTGLEGVSNYRVIKGDNRTAVLALIPTGFTSEMYVSYLENGTWTEWAQITGYNRFIRSYSAVFNEHDQLVVSMTLVDVDKEANTVFGDAHMVVVTDLNYNDLIVDNTMYCYENEIIPGEETTFYFDVTNISEETLYNVNVNISAFGSSETKTVACEIPAGESETLSFSYHIPNDLTKGTVEISVIPSYQNAENNTENNNASTVIGYADLMIEASDPELKDDTWVIPVKVKNQGYSEASASTITVYGGNASGETLETIDIRALNPGEELTFDYEIPGRYLYTATNETMVSLQFELETYTEESSYANNSDRAVYDSLTDYQDSISLDHYNITLEKGNSQTLNVVYDYTDETKEQSVEWSSSNNNVVTVENGTVDALGAGTAIVTAETEEGLTANCTITVTIPVTGISLSSENESIDYGSGMQLTAYVTPEDAVNKNVVWKSSDPSIATVDENGYVTATGKGTVYIEAISEEGEYSAVCEVRAVKTVYAEGIRITSNVKKINVGKSAQLRASFNPSDTTNQKVYWSSSNSEIATVDSFGKVTALAEGTVTITATSEDGGFTDSNTIEIIFVHTESVTFEDDHIELKENVIKKLKYTILPKDASNQKVSFVSDNESVLTVDQEGNIRAVSEGSAVVTVTTEDGNKTAQCTVTVSPKDVYIKGLAPSYTYTGTAIKPAIDVYDTGVLLTPKTDYTITYKNNTKTYTIADPDHPTATDKKKAPQIIIKSNSKGNYKGTKTIYFSIAPLDINDEQITIDELSVQAGTKPVSPVPVVYFNGKKLKAKTDFTVDYNGWDQLTPGDVTIKIHGKGNFQGTRDVTLHVASSDLISVAKLNVTAKTLKYADLNGDNFEEEIASAVTVKNGKKAVPADGYYFEDIPEDYKKTGSLKFTLVGDEAAGFYGKKTVTVKITGIALSDKKIKAAIPSYEYTGEPQTLGNDFSIKYNDQPLEAGTDYTIESYFNNINAGTATVVLRGLGNYTGTRKVTFKITPADATGRKITLEDAYYTKGGSKPKVTVEGLTEGTDYTLKYTDNKKVTDGSVSKWPTVTITFKGNYRGTVRREFPIDPKPLSAVTITAKDKVYSTKANAWKSAPVLKDTDGKTLKAGTDYEKNITYTTADGKEFPAVVEPGTIIKVTVTGKENYTDTVTTTYRILETGKDISKMTFKIANKEYTGSPVELSEDDILSIKIGKTEQNLTLGTDYEIVGYTNNVKKGTAKVTFRGKGDYGGEKIVTFKIGQRSIVDYWQGVKNFFSNLF